MVEKSVVNAEYCLNYNVWQWSEKSNTINVFQIAVLQICITNCINLHAMIALACSSDCGCPEERL